MARAVYLRLGFMAFFEVEIWVLNGENQRSFLDKTYLITKDAIYVYIYKGTA